MRMGWRVCSLSSVREETRNAAEFEIRMDDIVGLLNYFSIAIFILRKYTSDPSH